MRTLQMYITVPATDQSVDSCQLVGLYITQRYYQQVLPDEGSEHSQILIRMTKASKQ